MRRGRRHSVESGLKPMPDSLPMASRSPRVHHSLNFLGDCIKAVATRKPMGLSPLSREPRYVKPAADGLKPEFVAEHGGSVSSATYRLRVSAAVVRNDHRQYSSAGALSPTTIASNGPPACPDCTCQPFCGSPFESEMPEAYTLPPPAATPSRMSWPAPPT